MTPKRPRLTSHNNKGHALGLNQRALDFCFHKWEAFRKKTAQSSNLYDSNCMCVLNRLGRVTEARL